MFSCFSCVRLFVTLWTVVTQAPLSMRFPGKNTPPGDLSWHRDRTCIFWIAGRFLSHSVCWEVQEASRDWQFLIFHHGWQRGFHEGPEAYLVVGVTHQTLELGRQTPPAVLIWANHLNFLTPFIHTQIWKLPQVDGGKYGINIYLNCKCPGTKVWGISP